MKTKEYINNINNLFITVNQSISYIKNLIDDGKNIDFQDTLLVEEDLFKINSIIKELEQVNLCTVSQLEKIKEKRDNYYMIIDSMRRSDFKKTT
ncbi:hypothetical protein ACV3Z4_01250 [Clostridium perfringens]|uniref:hypothetical protein n=1 Tax=Clostridium perfringens TaxID=1502 RepID=UPI000E54253C|nr:hypothetical protein [Clostridium perfringens]EHR0217917.1 hypothetical protein [Clostridium perfringens]EJT6159405.1 hypothetical protein [Clostridium perfringens]ELC8385268.1 hypothetical protein [Clostridium perfringens]ELC8406612.1 hypothetical protein [Clostridium perfringens]MDK0614707.1 hypothetical protein [Clostridium perfringens]